MNWIDDFIKLYSSKEKGDFTNALELKRAHIPNKLYRYRTTNNLEYLKEEICDGEIFLSLPSEMNDPFDSHSVLGEKHPTPYIQNKDVFMSEFKNIMDKESFEKIFNSSNWLELLLIFAAEHTSVDKANVVKNAFDYATMKMLEDLNTTLNDTINKSYRFACFTEKSTNLPMWNHYANEHTGVCLEYDISTIYDVFIINRLFPIKYTKKLPDGTLLAIHHKINEFAFLDYFLMHKLNDWSYEAEWRLIFNPGSWYNSLGVVPKDYWNKGKKLKFAVPSQVILGTKIKESDEEEIRKWCKEHNIPVQKMKCTEYGLIAE